MNYLSHFYLDEQRGDAAFSVGGALPDLSRLRGKGFRLKPAHWVQEELVLTPLQESLEAGIVRHYAIDAHWHNAPGFATLEAVTKEILQEANIRLIRASFAVHIGTEMILDRALLHRDSALAQRFYACFTPEIVEEVFMLTTLKGESSWVPKLRIGMEAFLKRRYLEDYAGTYLSRTWPDIYQHVTGDDTVSHYPQALWMEVVEVITHAYLAQVDFEELRAL